MVAMSWLQEAKNDKDGVWEAIPDIISLENQLARAADSLVVLEDHILHQ